MDFAYGNDLLRLRAEAEAFAADAVARYGRHNDSWLCGYSRECARELAARGWIGLTWPTEFGGGGRPPIERLVLAEALISAGVPLAASWFVDRQMGPAIIAYGTEEHQRDLLPPMLAGESTWCIGMSEPDSGSDLASLQTRAVRDGEEWVISGRKIWTSFAHRADWCYLICRTDAVAGKPHLGISEIVVPMTAAGLEVSPVIDLTGDRHFNEILFDEVRVPVTNLVGVEGNAFAQTMRQLEHERGGIDRLVSNHALYRHALERADTTDPLLRQEIAALETGYRIGRILVTRGVLGQAPPGFSAATKCVCTEFEQRVATFAARVLGPDALLGNEWTEEITYAPAYTIMGGTSDVMRNIIGERTLGLPR
ncbi:MAG: acyl-CoA dehydrogenase family protein [Actinomycetes bacterium]